MVILIEVEGGGVQNVYVSGPDVRPNETIYIVADYDIEGHDEEDIQLGHEGEEVCYSAFDASRCDDAIRRAIKATL